MKKIKILLSFFVFFSSNFLAFSQQESISCSDCFIQNRWDRELFIESTSFSPEYTTDQDDGWKFIPVSGKKGTVQIQNSAGAYLHRSRIINGAIRIGFPRLNPTEDATAEETFWEIKYVLNKYFIIKEPGTSNGLHIEQKTGKIQFGNVPNHWWSAMWIIAQPSVTFQNRWNGLFLTLQISSGNWELTFDRKRGAEADPIPFNLEPYPLVTDNIEDQLVRITPTLFTSFSDLSFVNWDFGVIENQLGGTLWKLTDVEGGFKRISPRSRNNFAIHMESGRLELGEAPNHWWSAMWKISKKRFNTNRSNEIRTEKSIQQDIVLTPNPVKKNQPLSIQKHRGQKITAIEIFDITGKSIFRSSKNLSAISTNTLLKGLYVIRITRANNNTVTQKFVVN